MPELPELASYKQYVKGTALHKTIAAVWSNRESLVQGISFEEFQEKLAGTQFDDANRRGKYLILSVAGIPQVLLMHFGMTGQLVYEKTGEDDTLSSARVVFRFSNAYELCYINPRKLGELRLIKRGEKGDVLQQLGPEPFDVSEEAFFHLLAEHPRKNVKSFLMDQHIIAGIGNIYSDEILFGAGIDPHRTAGELTQTERSRLYTVMHQVLAAAVDILQSREGEFPSEWLIAHRRDKQCPLHNHTVTHETIAGRSAIYCETIQQ